MAKAPPAGRAMVRFIARTIEGAKAAPSPGFIEPMQPTLQSKLPAGAPWRYEIKLDGWRGQGPWGGNVSYAGDWVTRSIRRRGEPAFR